jgi:hypothetical protein
VTLLPEKELQALEEWFAELQAAVGFGPTVDRGRVLKSVRKLKEEAAAYAEEKRVVAAAKGYKRWGDLYNECKNTVGKTPEVELPEVFSEPPVGWLTGPGKSYDQAVKRLTKAQNLLKKTWQAIEQFAKEEDWEPGEEAKVKQQLVELFKGSDNPNELESTCYKYVVGYEEEEEEDPATTWVEVAELASSYLETDPDLPVKAVNELLAYASVAGVELTQERVGWFKEALSPCYRWFYYLVTTYLLNSSRATHEEVSETTDLVNEAARLWGCTEQVPGDNALRPTLNKTVWDPSVNLEQLKAAYKALVELKKHGGGLNRQEWEAKVREAVARTEGNNAATTSLN